MLFISTWVDSNVTETYGFNFTATYNFEKPT